MLQWVLEFGEELQLIKDIEILLDWLEWGYYEFLLKQKDNNEKGFNSR